MRRIPPWVDLASASFSIADDGLKLRLVREFKAELRRLAAARTTQYAPPDKALILRAIDDIESVLDGEVLQAGVTAAGGAPGFFGSVVRSNHGLGALEQWLIIAARPVAAALGVRED